MLSEKTFTYQEYLDYQENLEINYELVAGKIVEMPPESYINVQIAFKLMLLLIENFGVERVSNKASIIISGSRVTARIPDITVFSEEGLKEVQAKNTSTIDIDMLPPMLVVEVVSPGLEARNRDYKYKKTEYAARGIKYYLIVDPQEKKISFLQLSESDYAVRNISKLESLSKVSIPEIDITIDLNTILN